MSQPARTEDPSGNRYVSNQLVDRWIRTINDTQATIEIQQEYGVEVDEELLNALAVMMITEMISYIELSIRRGVSYAIRAINSHPPFHVSMDWLERWPSDIELRDQIVEESRADINNVIADMQAGDFDQARTRATQIGRTKLMDAFNEASRQRYQAFGIKRYRFHAHLGCCNEPKTLRDGTVVEGGCEELHNQTFPIEDTVHRPPIHPLGRCTILPVFD